VFRFFVGAEGADLLWRHLLDGRETEGVKLAHGLGIHSATATEVRGGLVDGRQELTTIFWEHWFSYGQLCRFGQLFLEKTFHLFGRGWPIRRRALSIGLKFAQVLSEFHEVFPDKRILCLAL
jgi:hypothetical protein